MSTDKQQSDRSDHDLLIEISAKLSMHFETFTRHCEEDAARAALLESSLKAVHRRVDWMLVTVVLTVLSLIASVVVTTHQG